MAAHQGHEHLGDTHGDVGSPPSPHGEGLQSTALCKLGFTVKSPLMGPRSLNQASLGKFMLNFMDISQNAAFFQQRHYGAVFATASVGRYILLSGALEG